MNRLFGSKRDKGPTPDLGDCVTGIDGRIESLEKKIERLNVDLKKLADQMKPMREGQSAKTLLKKRAITLLRQRKQYEQQLDTLRQQSFNLDQQQFALESVKDSQIAVGAMKAGASQMKREMKHVKIDDIDKLQDQLEDYMYQADELQEALSREYQVPEYDEADLEQELEMISTEIEDQTGVDSGAYLDEIQSAPSVPAKEPQQASKEIETDEFGLPVIPSKM